jgi:beta-glucoside operon transcriptional antiterminator
MRITKIYNNNVLSAVDETGNEFVLAGSGIGFSRKSGQDVDLSRVEKKFVLAREDRSGLKQLLIELPYEVMVLAGRISAHLEERHHVTLPAAVEIGLADHLNVALQRLDEDVPLHNSMLWETRASYPDEFRMALEVLDLVETHTRRRLPVDEAGFITMHLVNAGVVSGAGRAYQIAVDLRAIEGIVEQDTGIAPDGGSAAYVRFLTHLKFVLNRLTEQTQFSGNFGAMFATQKEADPAGWECATHIADYLHDRYHSVISDEEVFYLMIHLARLRHTEAVPAEIVREHGRPDA